MEIAEGEAGTKNPPTLGGLGRLPRMMDVAVFGLGQDALKSVVDRIADDQWSLEVTPAMRFREWHHTLLDIINHQAYDDAWVPDVLAGRTAEEVGAKFDGDLLGADPRAAMRVSPRWPRWRWPSSATSTGPCT